MNEKEKQTEKECGVFTAVARNRDVIVTIGRRDPFEEGSRRANGSGKCFELPHIVGWVPLLIRPVSRVGLVPPGPEFDLLLHVPEETGIPNESAVIEAKNKNRVCSEGVGAFYGLPSYVRVPPSAFAGMTVNLIAVAAAPSASVRVKLYVTPRTPWMFITKCSPSPTSFSSPLKKLQYVNLQSVVNVVVQSQPAGPLALPPPSVRPAR